MRLNKFARIALPLILVANIIAIGVSHKAYADTTTVCKDGTTVNVVVRGDTPSTSDFVSACRSNGGYDTSTKVASCANGTFFGLPAWHKYLRGVETVDEETGQKSCTPQIDGLTDTWKIVAAVMEMLLRVASLVAIGFIVYGGFTYTLSQGSPDKTSAALKTIINALVGLVISIVAAAVVGFIAGRF